VATKSIYDDMCFVIMPIGDGHIYEHFKHVYDDIFADAIKSTGFKAKRADDDKSSSMIQVEIIRDIVNAPMAICDLSTRNPNVLFELGIRQAFDLPVVLVQEVGTPHIFDISTINTVEYRKDRIYHEVLEDRCKIEAAINATKDRKKGINSIIKLLEIGKAELKENGELTDLDEIKVLLYSLSNEMKKEKDYSSMYSTNSLVDFWKNNEVAASDFYNIPIKNNNPLIEQLENEVLEIESRAVKFLNLKDTQQIVAIRKELLNYKNIIKSIEITDREKAKLFNRINRLIRELEHNDI
jgi:hypothetical protein